MSYMIEGFVTPLLGIICHIRVFSIYETVMERIYTINGNISSIYK